jgi:hypothetical protein
MNQAPDEAVEKKHWTYRLLRIIAYMGAAGVFWAWVIFLAMAGKF